MRRRRFRFLMSTLEHDSLRKLDDLWRGLLTPAGRVFALAAFFPAFLLSGGLVPPLVLAFAFMSALLACAVAFGLPFRPRVELERRFGPHPSAGDELAYTVRVRNTGRLTARNVIVEERNLPFEVRPAAGDPPMIPLLKPGESRDVSVRLKCNLRGAYDLTALQAASAFPSGLVKLPRRSQNGDRLLVYPKFAPVDFDLPLGRNYQPGGIAVASNIGESTEFFGAREWREGDRPRDIHWPSFARTGRLVVKEYQEEYFVRLAMVLDVEVRRAADEPRLERALSIAAGIADSLARREYIIDIFAAGSEIHHFQAGRALAHLDNILELLACIEGGKRLDVAALEAAILPEAPRLSAVVLVMMDWEPGRERLVQALRDAGVALRVVCVHPKHRPTSLAPGELVELQ